MAPPQTTVLHTAARDNDVSKIRSVLYVSTTGFLFFWFGGPQFTPRTHALDVSSRSRARPPHRFGRTASVRPSGVGRRQSPNPPALHPLLKVANLTRLAPPLSTPPNLLFPQDQPTFMEKMFKTKRPTIDAKDNVGRTPLIEASRYGCYDAVKYLLDNGASSRVQTNTTGSTCLHQAVKHRHSDVVKLLLAYGANPNVKNFDGVNCFELAQKNQFDDILYLLQNPDSTQVAKNRDYVPPLVSGLE